MKFFILTSLVFVGLNSSAYQVQTKIYNTMKLIAAARMATATNVPKAETDRDVAASSDPIEQSVLVYHSPDSNLVNKTNVINANDWANFKNRGATRLDLLLKLYFANIKDVSDSKQHHVGCFFGDAETLVNDFFKQSNPIDNVDKFYATVSEDRKMIGLEFSYKPFGSKKPAKTAHFRLPHCVQGTKTPLLEPEILKQAKNGMNEDTRSVASTKTLRIPAAAGANPATVENGFDVYDQLNATDANAELASKLPRFKLRADYDQMRAQPESRPWKGMDISTEANAAKFSQLVLDYFYDSLVLDSKDSNNNFNAQNIPADKPKWCHMPWLNVGDSGREMIHGLTKERDLEKSAIYPEVASTPDKQGSDWGVGFYNDTACSTAYQIFGAMPDKISANPDFSKANFPDGSVSVKVLFTTA